MHQNMFFFKYCKMSNNIETGSISINNFISEYEEKVSHWFRKIFHHLTENESKNKKANVLTNFIQQ